MAVVAQLWDGWVSTAAVEFNTGSFERGAVAEPLLPYIHGSCTFGMSEEILQIN